MPLKKATIFKRFNVGGYMKLKRKESEAIAQKKIELGRKAAQFKRLDNKVANLVNEIEERQSIAEELSRPSTSGFISERGSYNYSVL
ncbi:hypothetical protein QZH41_006531 [Actinostola sp. cb2023]|nr:hypothetical protein QZH41_006531 [Actinostola sp. cb2023]